MSESIWSDDEARPEPSREGPGGVAPHADWPGVVGVGNHLDSGVQSAGERERGTWIFDQDRLVKGMRVAGVTTLEQANHYLETEFLPWVNSTLAVAPASPDDAHRPLEKHPDLGRFSAMWKAAKWTTI